MNASIETTAAFIGSVYLAGVLVDYAGISVLAGYATLGDHFEMLGFLIVGMFVLAWLGAFALWRARRLDRRFADPARADGRTGEKR